MPSMEPMLMTRAGSAALAAFSSSGRQLRVRKNGDLRFVASTLSHAASGYSAMGAPQLAPALFTSTWSAGSRAARAAASAADPARVINIGSIDGLKVPLFETYAYSASKAALHHMTRVLARQLAPRHITVNAVAPGPFESKMMAATLERFRDAIVGTCPLGRIGEPDDMAGITIYLASRAGSYVTGAVIPVDGGISTCS